MVKSECSHRLKAFGGLCGWIVGRMCYLIWNYTCNSITISTLKCCSAWLWRWNNCAQMKVMKCPKITHWKSESAPKKCLSEARIWGIFCSGITSRNHVIKVSSVLSFFIAFALLFCSFAPVCSPFLLTFQMTSVGGHKETNCVSVT